MLDVNLLVNESKNLVEEIKIFLVESKKESIECISVSTCMFLYAYIYIYICFIKLMHVYVYFCMILYA